MNKKLSVLVVSSFQYPEGGAQTNRIRTYTRGLSELGHSVKLLMTYPTYREDRVCHDPYGNECFYISNKWTQKYFLIYLIVCLICFPDFLNRICRKNKVDVIILQDNLLINRYWVYFYSRWCRIKIIRDISEYPTFYIRDNLKGLKLIKNKLNFWFDCHLLDGIVFMTDLCRNFYLPFLKRRICTDILPMTVEPDRFCVNRSVCDKNIVYCGDMGGNKDGVDILITAFSLIAKNFRNVKLLLLGNTSDKAIFLKYQDFVVKEGLTRQVEFLGQVARDKIPYYLCNASLLVLARPDNKQAQGGFPTKFGEYLATGNPVIVTDTGEISKYLSDRKHCLLAIPDDVNDFADKISYALKNPKELSLIGRRGKKMTETVFNYKYQSQHLVDFIYKVMKLNKKR